MAVVVDVEELVIPDEIHDFLEWRHWLQADEANVEFPARNLRAAPAK